MTRKTAAIVNGTYREITINLGPSHAERHTPVEPSAVSACLVAHDIRAARARRRLQRKHT